MDQLQYSMCWQNMQEQRNSEKGKNTIFDVFILGPTSVGLFVPTEILQQDAVFWLDIGRTCDIVKIQA